jgi:tetratricopeptide (TPR) repeat protein
VAKEHIMKRLARDLLATRRAWWLGAGVSFASGVPTVHPLRARILHGLGLEGTDIALLEEKAIPFEGLFEALLSCSDCIALFEVFRGTEPALAHLLLARLAEHGLVRTVVTTNFDTLLEDALRRSGVRFDLYSTDEALASIDWSDNRIRVIKLHGSIDAPDNLAVTIRRVAARHYAERRGEVVRQLFDREPSGGVVILGYSCSDHFDVSPAARRYSRTDRCVWYVAHDAAAARSVTVAPLPETHPCNPFSGYAAQSATCVTDALLRAMWRILLGESPPVVPKPTADWHESVDSWIEGLSSAGTPGQKKYVSGLVLKSGNLWERSNVYLTAAIEEGLEREVHTRALLAVGNNLRDLGEYEEARRILFEAKSRAQDGSSLVLQARILNSLGIIAADVGDLDGAATLYECALAMQADDQELEGKCHGNLGIALKRRNAADDLDRALKHHQLAYQIARDIGDKRSEGRTLGNLGLVYALRGDLGASCTYYRAAGAVADSLGDLLHVAIWLHNEGEDTAITDSARAKELLERSRDIFRELGQKGFAAESSKVLANVESRRAAEKS